MIGVACSYLRDRAHGRFPFLLPSNKYGTYYLKVLQTDEKEIKEKCELEQISLPTISYPMDADSSTPGPVYDFDQLSRPLKDRKPSGRDKIEVDFKKKMDALMSEIERTTPHLKALDQYEALLEKERVVT